jgi:uncharacterized membrane protein
MDTTHPPTMPPTGASAGAPAVKDTPAKIVYVLYLLALITVHVTAAIGVVVAYVYEGDAPPALRTHYRFQIRTFWIALLYGLVSAALLPLFGIGVAGFAFIAVWIIVRCVKGLRYMDRREAIPDPATWLW